MAYRTGLAAALVAATYLSAVHAQVFYRGNCPKTPIIKDFDWDQVTRRPCDCFRKQDFEIDSYTDRGRTEI